MFVKPTRQQVLHVPESPVPLNSPEWLWKSPFKFNRPLPEGEVVKEIIYDQDRFYLKMVKRFKESVKEKPRIQVKRNQSVLFRLANCKPLNIGTQSFIYNEMDELNSPRVAKDLDQSGSGGFFGQAQSFHPNSPNFVSQHSILDLTHVSSSGLVVHAEELL